MPRIAASDVLERMNLRAKEFFLISAHREENVDSPENFADLIESLNALALTYQVPVIVSTHPRTKARLGGMLPSSLSSLISFLKPFGFSDYVRLQMESLCVISDSGTITEEAALLNLPAVTIRNAHERPEGMDAGTLIMCGLKKEQVLDSVRVVLAQRDGSKLDLGKVSDYETPDVSKKVLRTVLSYTGYVNRTVWRRQ